MQGLLSDCAYVSVSSVAVPAVRVCPPSLPITSLPQRVSSQKSIWPKPHLIQLLPFPAMYVTLPRERCLSSVFPWLPVPNYIILSITLSGILCLFSCLGCQLLSLYSVDQEDIKSVKQPKAFIWGLRACNPGDMGWTEIESMF